ncbi:hypothetical protein BVIET440_20185 [Burkholderia vietnamiensis]|nr:hypothetical protein BVI2075_720017 [Burkholderia vietnamiensis]
MSLRSRRAVRVPVARAAAGAVTHGRPAGSFPRHTANQLPARHCRACGGALASPISAP